VNGAPGRGRSARTWRLLAGTLAALVIAAAVLVGALRLSLALVPDHAARIQGWIERQTGLRLEFASLDARLRWWGPEAVLRDVRVLDPDATQALFTTREATVSIDVWNLFRTGELVAGRVRFVGPTVTVVRLPDGRIRLLGQRERPAERPPFDFDRLPAGSLEIVDATLLYEDRMTGRGPWVLQKVAVALSRAHDAVDVTGRAVLPESLGTDVKFDARLHGPLNSLGTLEARIDLSIDRVRLAGLEGFLPAGTGRPTAGSGPVMLTLGAARGQLQELELDLDLTNVALELPQRELPPIVAVEVSAPYHAPGAPPLRMPVVDKKFVERPAAALPREIRYARMAGHLSLGRSGSAWTFGTRNLVLQRQAAPPAAATSLSGRWRGQPQSAFALALQARDLRPADLWPLVLVSAPAAFDDWAGLDPRGEVQALDLDLVRDRAGSDPRFKVRAEVADLGVQATGRWPGLSGITASLEGNELQGSGTLESAGAAFEWPRFFRAPIALTRADAVIGWRRDGPAWVLAASQARAVHAAGSGRGQVEIRLERGKSPYLSTDATVDRLDVAALPTFIPVGRLMPATIEWFDQAFQHGEVTAGHFRYRGPVQRFPFRGGEGEMHATAQFKSLGLSYLPGYAPLEGGLGTADFHNASIRADLREGSVGGLRVTSARFGIDDYQKPVFEVDASATGDVHRALGFVQSSPLGTQLGELFASLAGTGAADYAFALRFATHDTAVRDWSVKTRLRSANVNWPPLRAPLTQLSGELEIDNRAIRGESLRGTYLDGPFELSVRPAPAPPDVAMSLQFEGSGRADGAKLPQVIGLPDAVAMSGTAQWRMRGRLDRPAGAGRPWPLRLEFTSDLTGLRIDAPQPFAKRPEDPRRTRVALDVPTAGRTVVQVESGTGRAALEFARRPDQRWALERGVARFDGKPVARPARAGLQVAGDWPQFDLAEWLALRSSAPGGPRLSDWLGPVDVHLDRAMVTGFELRDVTAHMRPTDGAWRVQVSGPMAEGTVTIPEDLAAGAALDLQMDRLQLVSPATGSTNPADASRATDPRDLPGIRLRAREFSWQDRHFGRLEADVRKDRGGLALDRLASESDAFALQGTGSWLAEDGGSRTRLDLAFSSSDLGAASRALGYRDAVDADSARIKAQVSWAGGPDADAIARMDGTLHLELEHGRLRGVEPGAGRILGLMSVGELPRRLSLDFRDVTEEGLAFDRVSGDFEIKAGSAFTRNLLLQGPAVDVGVVGRTGLAAQDYDQTIVVSGNPSGPITLAGAIAGGPVGAAGALLFSQLFKGQLKGLARVYYRVTGTWSNPVMERISASSGSVASSPAAEEVPR